MLYGILNACNAAVREYVRTYAFRSIQTMHTICTLFTVHVCNSFHMQSRAHVQLFKKKILNIYIHAVQSIAFDTVISFTPIRLIRACQNWCMLLFVRPRCCHSVYFLYLVYHPHYPPTIFFIYPKLLNKILFSSFTYV